MQTYFHTCGTQVDVAEQFISGRTTRPVFLDHQTGDGLDACPSCGKRLSISNLHISRPRVSRAKAVSPATQLARRLVARAKRIKARRVAA